LSSMPCLQNAKRTSARHSTCAPAPPSPPDLLAMP
jgi:hypothetical protein